MKKFVCTQDCTWAKRHWKEGESCSVDGDKITPPSHCFSPSKELAKSEESGAVLKTVKSPKTAHEVASGGGKISISDLVKGIVPTNSLVGPVVREHNGNPQSFLD